MKLKISKKNQKLSIPSIIASDLIVQGTLRSRGTIEIGGYIEGGVKCSTVNVYGTGVVSGDVVADNIAISGRISGNITARNVFLSETAFVSGSINYQSIIISGGAVVEGNMCKITKEESLLIDNVEEISIKADNNTDDADDAIEV